MEHRAIPGSRSYGSLDDPSSKKLRTISHDRLATNTSDISSREQSTLCTTTGDAGAFSSDGSETSPRGGTGRKRNWLTAAVICAMGVGTIMATTRPSSGSSSAAPSSPTDGLVSPEQSLAADGAQSTQQRAKPEVVEGNIPPLSASTENGLSFSMTNFYHMRDGKPGAQIPWLDGVQLAEPHRDTTVYVESPLDGHNYAWEVRQTDKDQSVIASATGAQATVVFTQLDWNIVTLRETDEAGVVTREISESVMVKYVRREIRTLTDDERNELLDAMAVLWDVRVQDGNGKELYGDNYADIWAINRLHFTAAGGFFCDHFHDGLGFLTSHSMMTNTFEYSLQVVNPKLTVPYWDFTIESSTMGGNAEGVIEPQSSSPVFSSDWFGRHDAEDYQLKDGRWAFTPIPRMNPNNPGNEEVDVYSKLRAPWNVNDRAYLSRSMGDICGRRVEELYDWPSCQSHYDLTTSYNDFYSWVWQSLYDPHGPVHVWLGGVMDCDETYAKVTDLVGTEISANLAYYSFVHRKNLFRSGYFKCSGTAEVNQTPGEVLEAGTCGCLDSDLTSGDDYKEIMASMIFMDSYIGDFDEDTQRKVVASLCNGLSNDGDHLQASSSLDPSFWVTHPTMERLWMYKRLTGTMTDLSWPNADTSVNGKLEILSLYSEDCQGHKGSDIFPFGLAMDKGDAGFKARTAIKGDEEGGNSLTNREILQALDPRVNKLSYIYDTFEWAHCDADGVHMSDAWPSGNEDNKTQGGSNSGGAMSKRPSFKEGELRYPMYSMFKNKAAEIAAKKARDS